MGIISDKTKAWSKPNKQHTRIHKHSSKWKSKTYRRANKHIVCSQWIIHIIGMENKRSITSRWRSRLADIKWKTKVWIWFWDSSPSHMINVIFAHLPGIKSLPVRCERSEPHMKFQLNWLITNHVYALQELTASTILQLDKCQWNSRGIGLSPFMTM